MAKKSNRQARADWEATEQENRERNQRNYQRRKDKVQGDRRSSLAIGLLLLIIVLYFATRH